MSNKTKLKKAAGFYVTAAAGLLCIASGIFYRLYFNGMTYTHGDLFSSGAFIALILAGIAGIVLLFIPHCEGYAPGVVAIGSGLSFLVYVHKMVWPIADIFTAIDPVKFADKMFIVFGLLVGTFIVAEVGLYMKKVKAAKA